MRVLNILHDNCEEINETYTETGVNVKGKLLDKFSYIIKDYVKKDE